MQLTIELEERDAHYLMSYTHLLKAERLNEDPEAPTTPATDFLPPDTDARIYAAIVAAIEKG